MIVSPEKLAINLLQNMAGSKQNTIDLQQSNQFQILLGRSMQKQQELPQVEQSGTESQQDPTGGEAVGSTGKESADVQEKPKKEAVREEETPNGEAAVAAVSPEVAPAADTDGVQVIIEAVDTVQVAAPVEQEPERIPTEEQPQEEPGQSGQAIIESVETVEAEEGIPAFQVAPPALVNEVENQSRFDDMLSQATEELQTAKPQETVETEDMLPQVIQGEEVSEEAEESANTAQERSTSTKVVQAQPKPPAEIEQNPLKEEVKKAADSVLNMHHNADAVEQREPERVQTTQVQQVQRPFATDQTEQIRVQVIENLENEKMEFRMQLQPEELGKVNVRMVLESGRLAVEIVAANPRAAELLSKQAEGLAASLRIGSLQVDSVQVVTETQSSSGQMHGAFDLEQGSDQHQEQQEGGRRDNEYDPQQFTEDDEPLAVPETLLDYEV